MTYPFEEGVRFTVNTGKKVSFPLYLRIPSWCRNASLSINGKRVDATLQPGKYVRVERLWKDNDQVELALPMEINTRVWPVNKHSVSLDYGPLTLSLRIEEQYITTDSKTTAISDSRWQEGADASQWPSSDILPGSPWNYALVTDYAPQIERRAWPADNNPFTLGTVPLVFKAKGRLVPSWQMDEYGLCDVLPYPCDPRSERVDEIVLVPMGAARLRISAFPTAEQ